MTQIAPVYKHTATNENSLNFNPFNRNLALVGIIPNQILSFSLTKIEELTAGSDEKKKNLVRIPARLRRVFHLIQKSVVLSLWEKREKIWLRMIPTRVSFRMTESVVSGAQNGAYANMAAKYGGQCKRPPVMGIPLFLLAYFLMVNGPQRHFTWGILLKRHWYPSRLNIQQIKRSLLACNWICNPVLQLNFKQRIGESLHSTTIMARTCP